MARLRLVFAWLLLLALPLQGHAAATVLQCGPAQRALAALAAAEAPAHAGHGHAGGHHAATAASHDAHDGHHGPDVQAAHDTQHDTASADSGHGCFACAAACHGVGLAGDAPRIHLPPAPQVHADGPFQGFESRPPPVPDKPPRA
jgi:hypothetical protein